MNSKAPFAARLDRRDGSGFLPRGGNRVFNLGLYFGLKPMVAVEAMTELIGLVASGAVKVNVDATLPRAEAAKAHHQIEQRQTVGKVILKPWQ